MTDRIAACSCGALRAHVTAAPTRVSVCHCLACQRRTGSVFGAQAWFPAASVRPEGNATAFVRVGDEGGRATFRFCPSCGATVYYTVDGFDDAIAVPVGAFAEPGFPGPQVSVYEERMHAWVSMPTDIEHIP